MQLSERNLKNSALYIFTYYVRILKISAASIPLEFHFYLKTRR